MTDKEFIQWLRNFLSGTDIRTLNLREGFSPTYNHTTMLKEIFDKLEEIKKNHYNENKYSASIDGPGELINRKDDQEYSQDNWNRGIKEKGPNPNSLLN